jgi:hypothetical protein
MNLSLGVIREFDKGEESKEDNKFETMSNKTAGVGRLKNRLQFGQSSLTGGSGDNSFNCGKSITSNGQTLASKIGFALSRVYANPNKV